MDEEEVKDVPTSAWYILSPPPTHYKGHYIHTVYSNNNRGYRDNPSISEAKKRMMLTTLGFVSSENYVLVNPSFSRVSLVLRFLVNYYPIYLSCIFIHTGSFWTGKGGGRVAVLSGTLEES